MRLSGLGYIGIFALVLLQGFFTGRIFAEEPQTGPFVQGDSVGSSNCAISIRALDGQTGVSLSRDKSNASQFGGSVPWFERTKEARLDRSQFSGLQGGVPSWNIPIKYPSVAFGQSGGGSPLYVGNSYLFKFSLVGEARYQTAPVLRILVYSKRKLSETSVQGVEPEEVVEIRIPTRLQPQLWVDFAVEGFEKLFSVRGLDFRLTMPEPGGACYLPVPESTPAEAPSVSYYLSHIATSDAFYYVIECGGSVLVDSQAGQQTTVPFAKLASSNTEPGDGYFVPVYAIDFTARLPWVSRLITQPHFDGEPMPSKYQNKTVEELLKVQQEVPMPDLPAPATCLELDNSPELRSHPMLDELAEDLITGDPNADALTITNYILNEIELTDAIRAGLSNLGANQAVELGGIKRGAAGVYLEGQGSPMEQCSLLVYLLRKAKIPAVYVEPVPGSLKVLDFQANRLTRMQLVSDARYDGPKEFHGGGKDAVDSNSRVPRLVSMNYPWVAAYVGGKWRPIFPWLADVEVKEGQDLYTLLASIGGVQNAMQWIERYVSGDEGILNPEQAKLAPRNTPADLFVPYIQKCLASSGSKFGKEAIGIQFRVRKHYYTQFEDLPRPFEIQASQEEPATYTSLVERYPNKKIFDTVQVQVLGGGEALFDSQEMLAVDLHNRRFSVHFNKLGDVGKVPAPTPVPPAPVVVEPVQVSAMRIVEIVADDDDGEPAATATLDLLSTFAARRNSGGGKGGSSKNTPISSTTFNFETYMEDSGLHAEAKFVIKNPRILPLKIHQAVLKGVSANRFEVRGNFPLSIKPFEKKEFIVRYKIDRAGEHVAQLMLDRTFGTRARREQFYANLMGTTIAKPDLSGFSAPQFEKREVGYPQWKTAQVSNPNPLPIKVVNYQIEGAGAGNFGDVVCVPSAVGPHQTAALQVCSNSVALGNHQATLRLYFTYHGFNLQHTLPLSAEVIPGYEHEMKVLLGGLGSRGGAAVPFGSQETTAPHLATVRLGESGGRYKLENLTLRATFRQNRFLEKGKDGDLMSGPQEMQMEQTFRKGDLFGICFNFGRVTQRMLDVHANAYWAERKTQGEKLDPELEDSISVYLMGMSYHKKVSDFQKVNSGLHKVNHINNLAAGIAGFQAHRQHGRLPNGELDCSWPFVDMPMSKYEVTCNKSSQSSEDADQIRKNYFLLERTNASAQEHQVLLDYLGNRRSGEAISTVRLLQEAKKAGAGILRLNKDNYQQYQSAVQPKCASLWNEVERVLGPTGSDRENAVVFLTGDWVHALRDANGEVGYKGMAGLFLTANGAAAYLSDNDLLLSGGRDVYVKQDGWELERGQMVYYVKEVYFSASENFWYVYTGKWTLAYGYENFLPEDAGNWSYRSGRVEVDEKWMEATTGPSSFSAAWRGDNMRFVLDPVQVVTGEFYVDQIDLTLPGPMSLALRRNYGSRNLLESSLGYGWRFSFHPYLIFDGEDHAVATIYATELDGSVIAYSPIGDGVWKALPSKNPDINNKNGAVGSNGITNPLNSQVVLIERGVYELRAADGSRRSYREAPSTNASTASLPVRLDTWFDAQGNKFSFEYFDREQDIGRNSYAQLKKIRASNGNTLGFVYDPAGRVAEVYTGDGRRVHYEYDDQSDLVRVVLPDNSEIRYEYGRQELPSGMVSNHLIVREILPGGRIVENDYDSKRRVIEQRATIDSDHLERLVTNARFSYKNNDSNDTAIQFKEPISGFTEIVDVNQKVWRYEYEQGQLTKLVDPLGRMEQRVWYSSECTPGQEGAFPRALASEIAKGGLTTTYRYDADGNIVRMESAGDFTGDGVAETLIEERSYNEKRQLVAVRSSANPKSLFIHYTDPTYPFLPTIMEQRVGTHVASRTVLEYGQVEDQSVYARGLLTKEVEAQGTDNERFRSWKYNKAGYPVEERVSVGSGEPELVTKLAYNLRGELIGQGYPSGHSMRYAYDAMGRAIWGEVRDEAQSLVGWHYSYYNANGEIEWEDGPRYNPEDYVHRRYDGAGKLVEVTQWRTEANADGTGVQSAHPATMRYKYDLFGNPIEEIDPRGHKTAMAYDAVGQVISKTWFDGESAVSSEAFAYNAGGLLTAHRGPLGGVTTTEYTVDGKIKKQINPEGLVLEWRYYLDGRVEREPVSAKTSWHYQYDDVERKVTKVLKQGDIVLCSEVLSYDRRGNVIRYQDVDSHVTTAAYNHLDAPVLVESSESAGGIRRSTRYQYDPARRMTKKINALGESTTVTKDALGRAVQVVIEGPGGSAATTTSYSYSPDHHSVTTVQGSGAGTLRSTRWTDLSDNLVLAIDGTGAKQRFVYDVAGNRIESIDPIGRHLLEEYDGLERLRYQVLPDGETLEFRYDAAGNLTERKLPGGVVWSAAYDKLGRQVSERLSGNGMAGRLKQYTYYGVDSPHAGKLQTTIDAFGRQVFHQYTPLGHLESMTAQGGEVGFVRFQTNRSGMITQIATPSSTVRRKLGSSGEILEEFVESTDGYANTVRQSWDRAGRRTSMEGTGLERIQYAYQPDGRIASITGLGTTYIFAYNSAGLLDKVSGRGLERAVQRRDTAGRILGRANTLHGNAIFTEDLGYYPDGKMRSYGGARPGVATWSDKRDFAYDIRGHLISEGFEDSSGKADALQYQFNPLGVRVQAQTKTQRFTALTVNGLGQVEREETTNGKQDIPATGLLSSPVKRVNLQLDGASAGNALLLERDGKNLWEATLWDVHPGKHALQAQAFDLAGNYLQDTSEFEVAGALQQIDSSYDAEGRLVQKKVSGEHAQTLTWDWQGQLVKVSRRNTAEDGFDWSAQYDGLGRRIQTTFYAVKAGHVTGPPREIQSFYDPQVEFLEVGVSVNGERATKLYGPDLDGGFGSLQGIGGLLAVSSGQQVAEVVQDVFGNVIGSVVAGKLQWNAARLGGYGALPGSGVRPLVEAQDLASVLNWRGKRVDETGYYWLGARYYDSESGRFLSTDPLGHEASLSLYDYAGGDPINFCDPDGRSLQGAYDASGLRDVGRLAGVFVGKILHTILSPISKKFADALFGKAKDAFDEMWHGMVDMAKALMRGELAFNRETLAPLIEEIAEELTVGDKTKSAAYQSAHLGTAMVTTAAPVSKALLTAKIPFILPKLVGKAAKLKHRLGKKPPKNAKKIGTQLHAEEAQLASPGSEGLRSLDGKLHAVDATSAPLHQTTILGENMRDRVIPFAQATDARTLPFGTTAERWAQLTPQQRWKLNDGALRARINEGDSFRYIGIDPARPPALRSQFDLTGSELHRLNDRGIPYQTVLPQDVMSTIGRP